MHLFKNQNSNRNLKNSGNNKIEAMDSKDLIVKK